MKQWDVFISHASEDKEMIARPLANKLIKLGLSVWYDEFELNAGDSLSRSIDRGLSKSRHGIVTLSPSFIGKNWPDYELRGLIAKSLGKERTIIPIWHNLNQEQILDFSPSLADIKALTTSDTIDSIALSIVSSIKPDLHRAVVRKMEYHRRSLNRKEEIIDLKDIKQGPIRHAEIPDRLINRITLIRKSISMHHPMTLEDWVHGFQRDTHPTREVEIWENIASKYITLTESINFSRLEKNKIYTALLIASLGSDHDAAKLLVDFSPFKTDKILGILSSYKEKLFLPLDENLNERNLDRETFDSNEENINMQYIIELSRALI